MHTPATAALAALALFITSTTAHSWVEEMDVIDPKTGTFTGTPGYCRNNTKRTVPGFSDPLMVHILPSAGQPAIEQRDTIPALDTTGVYPNDTMCKHTQQSQYQSNGSPRLQAAAGDLVALRYQENGHVSLPSNQPGKPANRGTVYIYGTSEPKFPELFLDVFGKWTADGTGGDGRGRLLATQPFDDGRCYQVNGGNISTYRQAHFPHTPNELMGANLWCQSNIALPTDAPTGKPYVIYWAWDWVTEPNVDPALPKGKAELYTTCMDIDIVAKPGSRRRVKARQAPQPQSASLDLNSAAIPAYVSSLIASPAPAAAATAATAASGAVSAQSSPAPAAASVAVSAQSSPSPASPESAAAPAAGVSVVANAGSDSMTNAGVSSYIINAVSAAIVAEAPKVPLTITVDIVNASTPMTAGAVVATQSAAAAVPAPVASPAYVATSASPAPSPAVASAPTQSASPAALPAATPAAASSPSTVIPSSPAQAPAMAPSSLPPKSLAINPPVLSAPPSTSTSISSPGFSGTASPVVASPAAEASSTSASVSPPGFSGTATPVAVSPAVAATSAAAALANSNSTSPAMSGASRNGTVAAKGQCQATTCKSKRQSKILGQKGGSRRLLRV